MPRMIIFCILLAGVYATQTPCNDGIDKVCVQLNTFIKAMSPMTRQILMCKPLVLDGIYTMMRGGDVWKEDIGDPDECYVYELQLKFAEVTFSCLSSVDDLMKEMQNGAAMVGMGRKRRFSMPSVPGVSDSNVNVTGVWNNLEVIGKLQYCVKTNKIKEIEPFKVKTWNFGEMTVGCSGGGIFQMGCNDQTQIKQVQQAVGACVQVAAGDIIKDGFMQAGSIIGNMKCA